MLEEMTAIINSELGRSESSNLTTHLIFLRNLCYRGVELMIDEEQGRSEGRNQFIPRDYLYERDRMKLHRFGRESGDRRFGGMTSG